jgi:MFS family permease
LRLLRHRGVAVLWVAQTLSVLGDRLYALALMWLVWQTTGSAVLMGLVAVAESVPYVVLGTFGRRVLGRFASLGRLGWVDLARAGVAGSLPLVWHADGAGVAALMVIACVLGVLGAVFDPNLAALVPDLVEPRLVQQVTGVMDLTGRIARVAGPASAGLLLAVLPDTGLYAVDAVTFGVSAAALGYLARHRAARPATRQPHLARAGRVPLPKALPLLRADLRVTAAIMVHGAGLLVSALPAIAMPVLLATRLHTGAAGYGLVLAASGLGALAGNPVAGNLRLAGRFPQAYFAAWAVNGVALALMGLAGSLPVVMVFAFLAGLVTPVAAVALRTYLSSRFSGPERLRLVAADQTVIRAAGTAGMLTLPALAAASPAAAFTVAGLAMAGIAGLAVVVTARLPEPTVMVPAGAVLAGPGPAGAVLADAGVAGT